MQVAKNRWGGFSGTITIRKAGQDRFELVDGTPVPQVKVSQGPRARLRLVALLGTAPGREWGRGELDRILLEEGNSGQTINRALQELEREEAVVSRQDPADGRRKLYRLASTPTAAIDEAAA